MSDLGWDPWEKTSLLQKQRPYPHSCALPQRSAGVAVTGLPQRAGSSRSQQEVTFNYTTLILLSLVPHKKAEIQSVGGTFQ